MSNREQVKVAVIIVASCYVAYHLMVLLLNAFKTNQSLAGEKDNVTTSTGSPSSGQQPEALKRQDKTSYISPLNI